MSGELEGPARCKLWAYLDVCTLRDTSCTKKPILVYNCATVKYQYFLLWILRLVWYYRLVWYMYIKKIIKSFTEVCVWNGKDRVTLELLLVT